MSQTPVSPNNRNPNGPGPGGQVPNFPVQNQQASRPQGAPPTRSPQAANPQPSQIQPSAPQYRNPQPRQNQPRPPQPGNPQPRQNQLTSSQSSQPQIRQYSQPRYTPRPAIRSAQPTPRPGTKPLGRPELKNTSIDSFQAPKNNQPTIITIAVLVIAALAILIGVLVINREPDNRKSGSSSNSTSAAPFENPCEDYDYCAVVEDPRSNGKALWVIDSFERYGNEVELWMTLTGTEGSFDYGFAAIDHTRAANYYLPEIDWGSDSLTDGHISSGEVQTGKVTFVVPEGKLTVILNDGSGRQVTMITIKT